MSVPLNPRTHNNPFFQSVQPPLAEDNRRDRGGLGFFTERRGAHDKQPSQKLGMDHVPNHNHCSVGPGKAKIPDKTSLALLNEYKEPEFDSLKLMVEMQDKMNREQCTLTTDTLKATLKSAEPMLVVPKEARVAKTTHRADVKVDSRKKKITAADKTTGSKKDQSVGRSVSKNSKKSTSRSKASCPKSTGQNTVDSIFKGAEQGIFFRAGIGIHTDVSKSPKPAAGSTSHSNKQVVKTKHTDFLKGIQNIKPTTSAHDSGKVKKNNLTNLSNAANSVEKKPALKTLTMGRSAETSKDKKSSSGHRVGSKIDNETSMKTPGEIAGVKRRLFDPSPTQNGIDSLLTHKIKQSTNTQTKKSKASLGAPHLGSCHFLLGTVAHPSTEQQTKRDTPSLMGHMIETVKNRGTQGLHYASTDQLLSGLSTLKKTITIHNPPEHSGQFELAGRIPGCNRIIEKPKSGDHQRNDRKNSTELKPHKKASSPLHPNLVCVPFGKESSTAVNRRSQSKSKSRDRDRSSRAESRKIESTSKYLEKTKLELLNPQHRR